MGSDESFEPRLVERTNGWWTSRGAEATKIETFASVACPASVLVERELAAALRGHPEYRLISVGPTKVQGFRGLRAWALRRSW